jgi:mannitol/fructose-specific phosphotransferase system IIA component (Ntr-type)
MNIRRFLRPESIKLELDVRPEPIEGETAGTPAYLRRIREAAIGELVELFAATGNVVNEKKLLLDLVNREKRASTAYEDGVAIPHVRTLQARSFVMAFARSTPGLPFGAEDGELTHIFFGLVAPPYDDRVYLRVYRTVGPLLMDTEWRDELMTAEDPHRVLRLLEVVRR